MNNFKSLWESAANTKVHLAKIVAGAQGWDVHDVAAEEMLGEQTHMYGFDLITGKAWLACIRRDTFSMIANKSQAAKQEWDDYRAFLGTLMGSMSQGPVLEAELAKNLASAGSTAEQALAIFLATYLGTTQTYELHKPVQENMHCIVLQYRKSESDVNGYLRPVMYPAKHSGPLQVEHFLSLVTHVAGVDRANHPEWF